MLHQSLTAEIAAKSKKQVQNFEPTFFSEIPYSNVTEINYLRDLEEKKKNIDFPIFQFEKDFGDEAPVNEFDMLANNLYKKIMQHGYIQQKKAPSKKKKKTKNPFEYDFEDAWINDEEAITVKKNIYVKIENFRCLNQGVDQFYDSQLYKSSLSQIQQQSRKRTNEITMDVQQLEEIKKKIKENISITHSKMKEQIEGEKVTSLMENLNENQNILKAETFVDHLNQAENNILDKQTGKNKDTCQVKSLFLEVQKQQLIEKAQTKEGSDPEQDKKSKKSRKTVPKPRKNLTKGQKQQRQGQQTNRISDKNLTQNQVQNYETKRDQLQKIENPKQQYLEKIKKAVVSDSIEQRKENKVIEKLMTFEAEKLVQEQGELAKQEMKIKALKQLNE